jgi:hypothetical protein
MGPRGPHRNRESNQQDHFHYRYAGLGVTREMALNSVIARLRVPFRAETPKDEEKVESPRHEENQHQPMHVCAEAIQGLTVL